MMTHNEYDVMINDIHHAQKKDAPSGTAITLAREILSNSNLKTTWINSASENEKELPIISERTDAVVGTHKVKYFSAVDDIEIIHTAHNRKGFASGALLAAEFIQGKKGLLSMKDVLDAMRL